MDRPSRLDTIALLSLGDNLRKPIRETLIARLFVVGLCVAGALLLSVAISMTECNPVNTRQDQNNGAQQQMVGDHRNQKLAQSRFSPNLPQRQRRHQQPVPSGSDNNMQLKRPVSGQMPTGGGGGGQASQLKRFRSAFENLPQMRLVQIMGAASEPDSVRNNLTNSTNRSGVSDINNNSSNSSLEGSPTNDVNNNNLVDSNSFAEPRRNINSVNGTIDLSQYAQSDVDRLYGDALLVYMKNFNDTLPTRGEIVSVNGSQPHQQVPVYRSTASNRAKRVAG